jgi:hypothetical protein
MRILVCGGRDYDNFEYVNKILDELKIQNPNFILIEGGASGADTLARVWALNNRIVCETYKANWQRDGKAAGPIRNELMLSTGINLVVAFPGGRGTNHMVSIAQRDSVSVMDLRNE